MLHGLLWLPLLGFFSWLAWAGWNEFQKVERYQEWASQYDRSKYDIYAVLAQHQADITWGIPTRHGPEQLQSFSLCEVEHLALQVGDQLFAVETDTKSDKSSLLNDVQGKQGAIAIQFKFRDGRSPIQIPFTDVDLAIDWAIALQKDWVKFSSSVV
jgi:hypothetical protein